MYMATAKKRINISLSPDLEMALKHLAKRDAVPQATKATYLIKLAIEFDEDDVLNKIAEERDAPKAKFVSHKKAWA